MIIVCVGIIIYKDRASSVNLRPILKSVCFVRRVDLHLNYDFRPDYYTNFCPNGSMGTFCTPEIFIF